MTKAEQFWLYAEEAMRRAIHSKSEKEQQALRELARTWTQAAMQCGGESAVVVNDSPPEARAQ